MSPPAAWRAPFIYISMKNSDGSWSAAKKISSLGPHLLCPRLSPDQQYLFFLGPGAGGDAGRAYWISAEIIPAKQ